METSTEPKRGHGSAAKSAQVDPTTPSPGLKLRLFRAFYAISRDRNTDEGTAIFFIVVCFLQIYDLLLSKMLGLSF